MTAPTQALTPEQLGILQHTLGLDEYGQGSMYRNHYVGEEPVCRELVALGFMRERADNGLTGGSPWFSVTEAGKQAIAAQSPKPPKVSRAQQRYRDWLDEDGTCSFGEWLKRGYYKEAA